MGVHLPPKIENPPFFRWRVRLGLQQKLGPIEWDLYIRNSFGEVALNADTGEPLFNETYKKLKGEIRLDHNLLPYVFNMNPEYDDTGTFLVQLKDIRDSKQGSEQNTFVHVKGDTGSGKSYNAHSFRMVLDILWDKRKICMTRGEVLEKASLFKRNLCLQQDEEPREFGQGVQAEAAQYKNYFDGAGRKSKVSVFECTPKDEVELSTVIKHRLKAFCHSIDGSWSLLAKYTARGLPEGWVLGLHPRFVLADTVTEAERLLSEYHVIKDAYIAKLTDREGLGNTSDDIFRRNEIILWHLDEATSFSACLKRNKYNEWVLDNRKLWNHVNRCFPYQKGSDIVDTWTKAFSVWFEENRDVSTIQYPTREEVFDLREQAVVQRDIDGATVYSDFKEGGFDYRRILRLIRDRGGKPPVFKKGPQPKITRITEEILEKG